MRSQGPLHACNHTRACTHTLADMHVHALLSLPQTECTSAHARSVALADRVHTSTHPTRTYTHACPDYGLPRPQIKRNELRNAKERLENGVDKIAQASAQVADLQIALKDDLVVVEEKKAQTDKLIVSIGKEKAVVDEAVEVCVCACVIVQNL